MEAQSTSETCQQCTMRNIDSSSIMRLTWTKLEGTGAITNRLLSAINKLVQFGLGDLAWLLKVNVVVRAHGAALVGGRSSRASKVAPFAALTYAWRHANYSRVTLDLTNNLWKRRKKKDG